MSVQAIRKSDRGGAFVQANGIDIHYLEVGEGEPLVLLHGGVVSTSSLWRNHPFAYADHMLDVDRPGPTGSAASDEDLVAQVTDLQARRAH